MLGYIYIILGFGFLIFIHELGHFLVARWCGVRCPYFAVGMGVAGKTAPILSYRKGIGLRLGGTDAIYEKKAKDRIKEQGKDPEKASKHDIFVAADELGLGQTEYRWMLLPIGGYVQMEGQEDLDPNATSEDPQSYLNQSVSRRAAILSAGVIMNFITGAVLLTITFILGLTFPSNRITVPLNTDTSSPVASTLAEGKPDLPEWRGLRDGDRITAINGHEVKDFNGIRLQVALSSRDEPIELEVLRGEDTLTYNIDAEFNEELGLRLLGVGVYSLTELANPNDLKNSGLIFGEDKLFKFAKSYYADSTDSTPVLTLTAINETPVAALHEALAVLEEIQGAPFQATFEGGSEKRVLTLNNYIPQTTLKDIGLLPATSIRVVIPESPAQQAGLQDKDIFVRIGDKEWITDIEDISKTIKSIDGDISLQVLRGNAKKTFEINPNRGAIGLSDPTIGILTDYATHPVVAECSIDGLDISAGSTILAVDNKAVSHWNDVLHQMLLALDQGRTEIKLKVQLNVGKGQESDLILTLNEDQQEALRNIQWIPEATLISLLKNDEVTLKAANPWSALKMGLHKTHESILQIGLTIVRLVKGDVAAKNMSGPIGIANMGAQVANGEGIAKFLYFLAMISINLAVLNLLPIPVLDGGHLVMLVVEKLRRGKRASERTQTFLLLIGLILLGSLMIFAFYNDIMRLLGK